ncbi:MAG: NAD(P)-dependent oxidoreductase [Candidatus Methanomethylicaceae archaeon]
MYLVTGATGFYGIHTVKVLLEKGFEVVAADLVPFPQEVYRYFTSEELTRLTFAQCDVSQSEEVRSLFREYRIEKIIHAAAITMLEDEEAGNERHIIETNALGTLNLLEAARESGLKRFIYISSSGVYGAYGHGTIPVHEAVPIYPGVTSIYCACKLFSEILCQNFHNHGAFRVVIARIGSPYGPWERPSRTRKNMSSIYRLVELGMQKRHVRVFGRGCVRDWTHMRDIARATVLLATCPSERLRYVVYNVASGTTTSIEYIVRKLEELIPGSSYKFVDHVEEADCVVSSPPQYARGPLDISRLREDTEFYPEFNIDKGLEDYVRWWREFWCKGESNGLYTEGGCT